MSTVRNIISYLSNASFITNFYRKIDSISLSLLYSLIMVSPCQIFELCGLSLNKRKCHSKSSLKFECVITCPISHIYCTMFYPNGE